jgi:hypothetical protein
MANHVSRPLALERLEERTLLSSSVPSSDSLRAAYAQLPLAFEANQGQAAAPVDFIARGAGYTLALLPDQALVALHKSAGTPDAAVTLRLVGANPAAQAIGRDELSGTTNYFLGNDPSRWRTNIPNFGRVEYPNVYPGINLVYYGNQGQLEYDFVVAPGAAPGAITLAVGGTDDITLDGQGNLVLHTAGDDLVEHAPVLYQESAGGRQTVAGRFVLEGANQIGFQVGAYDPSRPLVIDPVLSYSTYLGGSSNDIANGIAVDGSGNVYVTGGTGSTDFPTTVGAFPAGGVAFVTKLNATGTALLYSTYLGGSGGATGLGIAVDSAGNAYVTGTTGGNFPLTSGAYQTSYAGSQDAFLTKLNATGTALVYSTYLGGSGRDGDTNNSSNNIAVDGAGNAYVVGQTSSTDFPTTPGAAYPTWSSSWGVAEYVTEINPSLSGSASLVYSSYLPGTGSSGGSVAVGAGLIYVTGGTNSPSFPATPNAFQKTLSGGRDAFVAVLNPTLAAAQQLVYATYLGGSGGAHGNGIAVDNSGNAYVMGVAWNNFPTTPGAFQTRNPGRGGAPSSFVAKINPALSGSASRVYSTYLAETGSTSGGGIAVDGSGNAYVTGNTDRAAIFPTVNPIQSSMGSATLTAFVATLNASGSKLLFSTYLGGTNQGDSTQGWSIALDGSGNIYVAGQYTAGGQTASFPTTTGAFQTHYDGSGDAFVTKISAVVGAGPLISFPKDPSAEGRSAELAVAFEAGRLEDALGPLSPSDGSRKENPLPTLAPALPDRAAATSPSTSAPQAHSPSRVATDCLFADFVRGGLVEAVVADALLAPAA